MKGIIKIIIAYPPKIRKLIILNIDILLILFSLFLSIPSDSLFSNFDKNNNYFYIYLFTIITSLACNQIAGNYKSLTRYINSTYLYKNSLTTLLSFLVIFIINSLFIRKYIVLRDWFLLFFFILSLTTISRVIFRDIIFKIQNISEKDRLNVVIFGAGNAGVELYENLIHSRKFNVIGFVDDSLNKVGRYINNIPIYSRKFIERNKNLIDFVLLAIPSLDKENKKTIVADISNYGCSILQIPSLKDLSFGNKKIDFLNPIEVEDLLGREIVNAELDNDNNNIIRDQCICVTGAGGSIGSELCQQIVLSKPKKLILFEISEPSLYQIAEKLKKINNLNVQIIPILGNCKNEDLIRRVFTKYQISLIFHAAAYKHVSLVQQNPLEGISNNFISTRILCKVAYELNIKKFVLISSDKAVRPTSIMGVSKRLSELVVSYYADEVSSKDKSKTIFSMVRFGNVLGSSGSVVPLFKKQIKDGGPVTVTHPEVIRYFMTINEAANLVIQAGALSKGGELFLLDMGQPVKIKDLAKQMINLTGLTVRDEKNPKGDIEIKFVGLREGEKLYEELLIDGSPLKTKNPLIFIANESKIKVDNLNEKLIKLEDLLEKQDEELVFDFISKIIPEWTKVNT